MNVYEMTSAHKSQSLAHLEQFYAQIYDNQCRLKICLSLNMIQETLRAMMPCNCCTRSDSKQKLTSAIILVEQLIMCRLGTSKCIYVLIKKYRHGYADTDIFVIKVVAIHCNLNITSNTDTSIAVYLSLKRALLYQYR